MRAAPLLALCGALSACGQTPGTVDPGPDAGPPIATADQLFGPGQVARLDFWLSNGALTALRTAPREYVRAQLEFQGRAYPDVGLRLKGTFSFQGLDGKAAFKVKLNEFVAGQTLLGLESLTLNNQRQDHTLVHEHLAYAIFRAAGVAAPRSGFAEVYINREPYGLYALVESIDDVFLADRFADGSGNLYEATLDDLLPEDLWEFDQDEGDDTSRADLAAFIDAANQPGDGVFFADDAPLDTDDFLAFVASEAAAGHWDGYWKSHNYRIYREPALGKWYFIPWGIDQGLERRLDPLSSRGLLAAKCVGSPRCLAAYAAAGHAVADAFTQLDLEAMLDHAAALTADAMAADERQRFELDEIERSRGELRLYLRERAAELHARYDCIEGGVEADRDGDGHGACLTDCDDGSAAAHPGGVEACDGLDNDCDGLVDDLDDCPCDEVELGGARFALCDRAFPWARARSHCAALGGGLAWVDGDAQNAALFAATQERRAGWWYLGVDDRAEEGTFVGSDGGDGSFAPWTSGEPDDWGGQDCGAFAALGGGEWGDVRCADPLPFVCRMP